MNEGERRSVLYQCVVKADVSFQAGVDVVKLYDGDFGCSDGQDVLQIWQRTKQVY